MRKCPDAHLGQIVCEQGLSCGLGSSSLVGRLIGYSHVNPCRVSIEISLSLKAVPSNYFCLISTMICLNDFMVSKYSYLIIWT